MECVPNKSLILKFPNKSIFKENHLINSFVRGYVDGDGCYWVNKNGKLQIEIIGTLEFLTSIQEEYNNLFGSILSLSRGCTPDKNTFRIMSSNKKAIEFINLIYRDSTIFLQRKYDKIATFLEN